MLEKNRMKLLKLKRISKRREFIEVPHLYPYKKNCRISNTKRPGTIEVIQTIQLRNYFCITKSQQNTKKIKIQFFLGIKVIVSIKETSSFQNHGANIRHKTAPGAGETQTRAFTIPTTSINCSELRVNVFAY